MTDLIVNGKSIREFGNIYLSNIERPAMAKRRITKITLMGKDGSYEFEDGLEDTSIKFDLVFVGMDEETKRFNLREIVAYMQGKLELVFTDEPEIMYKAKLVSISGLQEMNIREICSLEFICEPYKFANFEENNITLNSDIKLMEKITLDTSTDSQFSISSDQNIIIDNIGSSIISPLIEISGSAASINVGGFTINNISTKVFIDTDRMICYTLSGSNKINKIKDTNGNFEVLKLNIGTNNISITGTGMNLTIRYRFRNKYL